MFDIINETNEDIKYLKDIEKVLTKMTDDFDLHDSAFNVIIIDNEQIKQINKQYRNIDKPTDVISFALEDFQDIKTPIKMLGDIYISIDKAKEQAIEYNHSLQRELAFLTTHGMLHLLGYDHMNEEDEKEMFENQNKILKELGYERGK